MAAERLARILALLLVGGDTDPGVAQLCRVCASVTVTSGAVIMLVSDDARLGSWCTSGEVSVLMEEAQYTLGEGPCIDAYNLEYPVIEPDLANPETVAGRRSRPFCSGPGLEPCSASRFG